jgi:taurine dioxygenase
MRAKPLSPLFGAEIEEIDLSQDLDDQTFARIEQAFNQRSVVLFRNQRITHAQHVAFSRRFGELEIHVLREYVRPEHPEIYVLSNIIENGKAVGIKGAGNYWHTISRTHARRAAARSCTRSKCRRKMACIR